MARSMSRVSNHRRPIRAVLQLCFMSSVCFPGSFVDRVSWTSMIGNGQGETEIPVDPAKQVPRASKGFWFLTVLDRLSGPPLCQRGQTSICGNNAEQTPSTKIELE